MAKEKKIEHIQVKDNGIKISQKVGDALAKAKQLLERDCFKGLLQASDETSMVRYRIAQNNAFEKYRKTTQSIIKNAKNEVKQALKEDKTVNLSNKQVVQISSQINNGLVSLGTDAMKAYQSTLRDIVLKVKSAGDLKEQLGKHIASGLNIGVTYKDGKTYQFDTYFEMKARTDIQQEIGNNMISTGQENGIIFYITSFYGDCAPDHVNYQGKIYVDEKWESMAPKDRLDEIRDYINANKILTVQEVTQGEPFLTTRPNCRHYFQYIDIDSVLGAKTKEDVNNLRQERDLNFGGKYKPDKYKALQQQRQNERKIRSYKADLEKKQISLALEPGNKQLQSEIEIDKSNIRMVQKAQRDLAKQYSNIERRYDREKVGNRIDFGISKSPKGSIPEEKPIITESVPKQEVKVEEPKVEEKPKEVSYSKDQLNAVESYVSGDMMWINQYLRGVGEVAQYGLSDSEKAFLQDLKEATSKEVVEQKVLYRSLDASVIFGRKDSSFLDSLNDHLLYGDDSPFVMRNIGNVIDNIKGKEIVDDGFMSTTTDKVIAGQFTYYTGAEHPVVLELQVPDGVHGFPVYKHFEQEEEPQKEVLLEPGIKIRIDSIETYQDRENDVDKQILVKATIIK